MRVLVCPPIHRVQHQTGVYRMNSSHGPRRRRTQPQAKSSLKSYRHIGKSGSARGRSADRLSGKADRLGRHLQGWCAKVAPHHTPVPAQRERQPLAKRHEPCSRATNPFQSLCRGCCRSARSRNFATHDERSERPSPRAVQVVALAVERWRSPTTHAAGHGHVRLLQRCSAP